MLFGMDKLHKILLILMMLEEIIVVGMMAGSTDYLFS